MKKSIALFSLAGALSFSAANAETYTWTDSAGTVHFTEDPGTVPKKLRNTVRKLDDAEQPQPDNRVKEAQPGSSPDAAAEEQSTDGMFDGKSYGQWQQELASREADMVAVQKRIDEIAEQLKHTPGSSEAKKKLFDEYNPLFEKLKVMKTEYYQLVEAARKAGLTVNLQEQ
ncbi:MAG: DUF4124 domain-containing protein [Geobacter sp.]|nr:DUF4124 domain-containing protein [Geobacter sp.]